MSWRPRLGPFSQPRGRGNAASGGPEICRRFQRGLCIRGASCRFFCGAAPIVEDEPREPPPDDNFVDFKLLLRGGSSYGGYYGKHEQATKVWASAVLVLEGKDQETQQLLVKDLVNDEFMGLQLIKATLDMNGKSEATVLLCAYNFLRVITYSSLLDPLSVDSFVSTIYNSFGGHNGDKATTFLLQLRRRLAAYFEGYGNVPVSTITEFVSLMLKALAELFNREARARFNEDLATLLDNIQALAALAQPEPVTSITPRIDHLRRLVVREAARVADPEGEGNHAANHPLTRSTFKTQMILPGGRHNNDSADISNIQILPTYSEIVCDSPEYLPSTDFTRPHFLDDPLQRHIDSTFRLLRYDIFSPVKDVMKELLA